ncbi:hypothetical protein TWF696_007273 [Orbilia brochopaga]|uniref:Uncharacterized protein n=1 Tax=Orbilia brochopaga TaxID=3140254 RepID=A0AAV9UST4_9PEZI
MDHNQKKRDYLVPGKPFDHVRRPEGLITSGRVPSYSTASSTTNLPEPAVPEYVCAASQDDHSVFDFTHMRDALLDQAGSGSAGQNYSANSGCTCSTHNEPGPPKLRSDEYRAALAAAIHKPCSPLTSIVRTTIPLFEKLEELRPPAEESNERWDMYLSDDNRAEIFEWLQGIPSIAERFSGTPGCQSLGSTAKEDRAMFESAICQDHPLEF